MKYTITTKCPQDHRCPLLNICPVDAISQKGNSLPIIDQEKCIKCGACFQSCGRNAVLQGED